MSSTFYQLSLVGVCCSGGADGTDPYAEVSLQPLPEYTVPSDGITMTCITCTEKGRIFLAGRDGHIYELQYTTGSGWQSRCRKVCLTAGLGSIISRLVPLFVILMPHFYIDRQACLFFFLQCNNCACDYQIFTYILNLIILLR